MKTGIELIAEERRRQIEEEGYSIENDQKHEDGELADAAALYALSDDTMDFIDQNWGNDMYLHLWPFDLKYLKKSNSGGIHERSKDLIRAGALIAAELDRLQNME